MQLPLHVPEQKDFTKFRTPPLFSEKALGTPLSVSDKNLGSPIILLDKAIQYSRQPSLTSVKNPNPSEHLERKRTQPAESTKAYMMAPI